MRIAKQAAEAFTPGGAFDAETRLGPLVSKTQQERVRGYIRKGIEEGATLVTGGAEQPEGLPKGYFVRPTVFANVKNGMTIAQQEIFGPVLCIIPYDDEEDAIRIANDSAYGLGGRRLVGRRRARPARRAPHPYRSSRHQRRRLQPHCALRRLQAVGPWARVRQVGLRGVPRDQEHAALKRALCPTGRGR